MPFTFPPEWYLFIYLHWCAFELLGWQEQGPSNGSSPRRGDSNRRPSDRQAQEAQWFRPKRLPLFAPCLSFIAAAVFVLGWADGWLGAVTVFHHRRLFVRCISVVKTMLWAAYNKEAWA